MTHDPALVELVADTIRAHVDIIRRVGAGYLLECDCGGWSIPVTEPEGLYAAGAEHRIHRARHVLDAIAYRITEAAADA